MAREADGKQSHSGQITLVFASALLLSHFSNTDRGPRLSDTDTSDRHSIGSDRSTEPPNQGLLQLDDIGGQHDPHLRIIGGHCETLGSHIIHVAKERLKRAS